MILLQRSQVAVVLLVNDFFPNKSTLRGMAHGSEKGAWLRERKFSHVIC